MNDHESVSASCAATEDRLLDAIAGRSLPAEARAHLAACPACATEHRRNMRARALLRAATQPLPTAPTGRVADLGTRRQLAAIVAIAAMLVLVVHGALLQLGPPVASSFSLDSAAVAITDTPTVTSTPTPPAETTPGPASTRAR